MNLYKKSIILSEVLGLLLAGTWIIYKIKAIEIDDLIINITTYVLFIYVAIGNLTERFSTNG